MSNVSQHLLFMKVCLKNLSKNNLQSKIDVLTDFLHFLQSQLKLHKGITIHFVDKRDIPMTTGVRLPNREIHILSKNRLLVDIFRTIAHEWVHEFQHQVMGVPEEKDIKNIGGPEENMASALASIFLKKFQVEFPKYEKKMFGEN